MRHFIRTALVVALALAGPPCPVALAAGQSPPADPATGGPGRYLEGGGRVYAWDGSSARVMPAEPRGDLPEALEIPVVEPYARGERLLVLLEHAAPSGKGRGRKEGLGLVFDTTGTAPRRLHEVTFEGRPYVGAINADGSRGYVLAHRPSPDGGEKSGRSWIHEIDLVAGRLLGSSHLTALAAAIAVQADGRRVFVGLPDRIQSFSTGPLVGSWHYRSPGPNDQIVIRPIDGALCVARGEQVALFDPAAIAGRSSEERHGRDDDASAIVALPFQALGLDLSDDGLLAVVRGSDRLAFLDCATQSLIWPADPPIRLSGVTEVRALAFPGAGRDLVVALFPAGDVVACRAPATPGRPIPASSPPATAPPEPERPDTEAMAGVPAPESVLPAAEAAPTTEADPLPAPPEQGPVLTGRISGGRSQSGAVVMYGPNNIVKEFGRVRLEPDGRWRAPLPPPGTYRLVAIGDGSGPLATSPAFLTVRVTAGEAQSGLDFEIIDSPSPPR